ncbi:exopolyphosphatase [Thiohalomonas denitrificans]|uniref:Exopolyphosphatase n=1 Tax=Thiohalomonas denitrificans TaxID=415747 RepID=A0A1G5PRK1_9GAMM|nr:exopolyphosphatase [Thiohalomonas denitrificans]SCZ51841.1 exopolyphosphatase / guanosine-5'-triphosphate,3'-diphosphate pyrophosphatase [Thiohalomonas denitrificans]
MMAATEPGSPDSIAAVDLGSNSFHLIVAQPLNGHMHVVDRLRETVRLAAGLDARDHLSADARERALECLRRFGQRLEGLPPGSVRVVGTNTLRKARNAGDFIEEATAALGHPVEIIAGREEARLIYLGVSHSLPDAPDNHLVVDIGGGSTEVIIGKRFEALHRESLHMGCVSYSRRFFPKGRLTKSAMDEAVIAARLELEPVEADYRRFGWSDAVGASGTAKAVRQVMEQNGWSESGITLASLRRLSEAMIKAGHVDNLDFKGLKEERRPVFAGGVAVLIALFEALEIEAMQVSEWALREGVLYDLIGRIRHEDVRERTITAMAKRYNVDAAQAQRVEKTTLALLEPVADPWGLDGGEADYLLGWAARLHEIGLAVAHSQHHKHAAYLLENSDMPGFSRQEQQSLALLVRSHRQKFPAARLKGVPPATATYLQRMAVLLRLAVALHRSRNDASLSGVGIAVDGKRITLKLPKGWLDANPLTRADLEVEARFLSAANYKFTFG